MWCWEQVGRIQESGRKKGNDLTWIICAGPAHAVYFATYEVVKQAMGGNAAGHHPIAAGTPSPSHLHPSPPPPHPPTNFLTLQPRAAPAQPSPPTPS